MGSSALEVQLLKQGDERRTRFTQEIFVEAGLRVDVEQELARDQSRIFFVETDDCDPRLLGVLLCWRMADEVEVLDLAVAREWRRQGWGRLLLKEALLHESQKGAKKAFLEVRRGNDAARRLYESCGFQQEGVRVRYYRDGEDALLYHYRLLNLD